ncbi:MAG: hypothetical protein ACK5O7_03970 [Holosporales bacterium]
MRKITIIAGICLWALGPKAQSTDLLDLSDAESASLQHLARTLQDDLMKKNSAADLDGAARNLLVDYPLGEQTVDSALRPTFVAIAACVHQEPELMVHLKHHASLLTEIACVRIEEMEAHIPQDLRQVKAYGLWLKLYRQAQSSLFLEQIQSCWRDEKGRDKITQQTRKNQTREITKEYLCELSPFDQEPAKAILASNQREALRLLGLLGNHSQRLKAAERLEALEWTQDALEIYFEPTELALAQTASPHYGERVLRGVKLAKRIMNLKVAERGLLSLAALFEKRLKTKDNHDHLFDHYCPEFLSLSRDFQQEYPDFLQDIDTARFAVRVMRAPLKRSKALTSSLAAYCKQNLKKS